MTSVNEEWLSAVKSVQDIATPRHPTQPIESVLIGDLDRNNLHFIVTVAEAAEDKTLQMEPKQLKMVARTSSLR